MELQSIIKLLTWTDFSPEDTIIRNDLIESLRSLRSLRSIDQNNYSDLTQINLELINKLIFLLRRSINIASSGEDALKANCLCLKLEKIVNNK